MYDLQAGLRRLGGDREILQILAQLILDDSPPMTAQLERAIRSAAWKETHLVAHGLRRPGREYRRHGRDAVGADRRADGGTAAARFRRHSPSAWPIAARGRGSLAEFAGRPPHQGSTAGRRNGDSAPGRCRRSSHLSQQARSRQLIGARDAGHRLFIRSELPVGCVVQIVPRCPAAVRQLGGEPLVPVVRGLRF